MGTSSCATQTLERRRGGEVRAASSKRVQPAPCGSMGCSCVAAAMRARVYGSGWRSGLAGPVLLATPPHGRCGGRGEWPCLPAAGRSRGGGARVGRARTRVVRRLLGLALVLLCAELRVLDEGHRLRGGQGRAERGAGRERSEGVEGRACEAVGLGGWRSPAGRSTSRAWWAAGCRSTGRCTCSEHVLAQREALAYSECVCARARKAVAVTRRGWPRGKCRWRRRRSARGPSRSSRRPPPRTARRTCCWAAAAARASRSLRATPGRRGKV